MQAGARFTCAILFRRAALRAEVDALVAAIHDRGWRALVIVLDESFVRGLSEETRRFATFVMADGRRLDPRTTAANKSAPPRREAQASRQSARAKLRAIALAFPALRAAALIPGVLRDRRRAARLIEAWRPGGLIVFDDRAPRPDMAFVQAARAARTPVVLAPFAVSSPESDAWIRSKKVEHSLERGFGARGRGLLARLLPRHARQTPHGRQLFFAGWETVALAALGLAGGTPWAWGGGASDKAGMLNAAQRDAAIAEGVQPDKLVVTGQPSSDRLHAAWSDPGARAALRQRFGFSTERPVVLLTSPHYAEHGMLDWPAHWGLIDQIYRSLGRLDAHVLVSLHPKSDPALYLDHAREAGVTLSDLPFVDILPVADLMVTSWSSTARLAACLGVPVVNIDPLGAKGEEFDIVPAIRTLPSIDQLGPAVGALLADPELRAETGRRTRAQAEVWGAIDGKACERVLDLISPTFDSIETHTPERPAGSVAAISRMPHDA